VFLHKDLKLTPREWFLCMELVRLQASKPYPLASLLLYKGYLYEAIHMLPTTGQLPRFDDR
jgi:hypothetical protein